MIPPDDDILDVLQASPFFDAFPQEDLEHLARHGRITEHAAGTALLTEGAPADHLYLLVEGEIRLFFKGRPDPAGPEVSPKDEVLIHSLSDPGRPLGWSCLVEPFRYRASAEAVVRTRVVEFERAFLEAYGEAEPRFGAALMRRILWVLGNRLRATRIRLVAKRYEAETLAVQALLDQSAEVLSVTSPLHRIRTYLDNRLTLSDAFYVLESMKVAGDEQERQVAELSLEILENVHKEMELYQRLQRVYEVVASADASTNPVEVRRRCSEQFAEVFALTDYIVTGEDRLPASSGHIFIMNHLCNHPENTLPNDFQLTLDTHFVSSVILHQHYGESPVRVVRKSRLDEFAHQRYYDRLGYIWVYQGHVDESEDDVTALADERRRLFLDQARAILRAGTNIVICPEGTSVTTERSPVRFKAGAFRLAAHVRPEPLIVPIAVANFDKKVTRVRLSAVVHQPFRLSDVLPEPVADADLYGFLDAYHERYKGYVADAVASADRRRAARGPHRVRIGRAARGPQHRSAKV